MRDTLEMLIKTRKSRTRPFKILELISMIKIAEQGIIICSYDSHKTLNFFRKGLDYISSYDNEKIIIQEIEKNKKMSLTKFITSQLKYGGRSDDDHVKVISNIYDSQNLPTYEFLNQVRSYYTKINHPIIFWFYQPFISWLYKLAPDFMRVQITSFQFEHKDTVEHSKFLKITPNQISEKENKFEYLKKEIFASYSTQNYDHIRDLAHNVGDVFDYDFTEKNLLNLAYHAIMSNNKQILPRIDEMIRFLHHTKGRERIKELQKYVTFCNKFVEWCKKNLEYKLALEYELKAIKIKNEIDKISPVL